MTQITGDRPFYTFVREERQFSFLLAHFLMQKGPALSRFFELVRRELPDAERFAQPSDTALDSAEVYVEFAELRDRWDSLLSPPEPGKRTTPDARAAANDAKRAFIQSLFARVRSLRGLTDGVPEEPALFNAYFMGEAGERIKRDIASPALWSVKSLASRFGSSPPVFLDLCKLKWSFHIKPDIVIRTPGIPTICVEAKLESAEGSYPRGEEAKLVDALFGETTRVGQFELQRFMFKDLLGKRRYRSSSRSGIPSGRMAGARSSGARCSPPSWTRLTLLFRSRSLTGCARKTRHCSLRTPNTG